MKKKGIMLFALLAGVCFWSLLLSGTAEAASKVKIDRKHFPDRTFRQTVKSFDKNKDGYLSDKESKAVKSIELENENCALEPSARQKLNLKGIEYFPQTKELNIVFYRLKNLKLGRLKNLKTVKLDDCQKADGTESDKKYDFTKNKKLEKLCLKNIGDNVKQISFARGNKIKSLELTVPKQMPAVDLSRLSQMEDLQIHDSGIETVDLRKCVSLKKVWICNNKNLKELTFGASQKLKELEAGNNHLVSLDVSQLSGLESLWVSRNNLSELDVSRLPKLKSLAVDRNNLSELNVSGNTKLTYLDCSCNLLKTLDVTRLKDLRNLSCGGLGLRELDLKGNPKLEGLDCSDNCLETLDISGNTKLTGISCNANPLEELDVSMLSDLKTLWCHYARLTNLDLSGNAKLEILQYAGNRIPSLDLTGHSEKLLNGIDFDYTQKSQLLPQEGSMVEEGVPIDREHFPDYALRYAVLADFDTNRDGVLSEKESLAKQPVDLGKYRDYSSPRREIDCMGMGYLKGITEVKSGSGTILLNNTFKK